jgi:hypothetical protein
MLRAFLADMLNPIVWNLPGNAAKKFYSFSRTEYSSVHDLLIAARNTDSDQRASQYLHHLEDEYKHTSIFLNRANKLRKESGKPAFPHPGSEYEMLFDLLGEKRFLAFVHLGEKRGCIQFTSYARYFEKKGDEHTASIFRAVLQDEVQHMNYTYELLETLCGSKAEARKELRRARSWEMRRGWMRSGRALTGKLFFLITISIYPLFLPYKMLYLFAPARARSKGWKTDVSAS